MTEPNYDIYINGKLKDGVSREQATANLAALFKTSEQKAAALVDGRPHRIKRGLRAEAAKRYLAALQRAGFETGAKKCEAQTAATTATATATTTTTIASSTLDLAPPGTPVLREDERQQIPDVDIDTSALGLTATEDSPTFSEPRQDIAAPEFDIAPPGSDLEQLADSATPLDPDTSALTIAEPGAKLGPEHETPPPPPPATDHIKLDQG